jgi:FAD/FMN-containing dehydrogenase
MTAIFDELRAELPGAVYGPDDEQYSTATTPDNSSYRQSPVAVVRPAHADDVARTVAITGRLRGRVLVQATGHGAGAPVGDDTVLLDTSALTDVIVDPAARTARVGAGVMWPAVQTAAIPHGLLGLAGTSPTVGVAGYTFSGGVGWLVRKHGLASAALRAVEYVDGGGRVRRASEDAPEHLDQEALWAFRGGAPVGFATSIDMALAPVADLWTGFLLWPADALSAVALAWSAATGAVSGSVTSSLALLHLPPEGPFPVELLGTTVVHLSYASPDGGAQLEPMRDAVRAAAAPVVDTTASGDIESLAQIHLDPPSAVPARGMGRWLSAATPDVMLAAFDAARVGQAGGLNMIEVRHTESHASAPAGAMTIVPAPFLVHAVGAATDDGARRDLDDVLEDVQRATGPADIGRSAPAFREGQPDAADAMQAHDIARLRAVRHELDPNGVLTFQRHPAAASGGG